MAEAGVLKGRGAEAQAGRRTHLRRWLRRLGFALLAFVLIPYFVLPLYAVVNPPIDFMMLQSAVTHRVGIDKTWVGLDQISPRLVRAVLASEDARFCSHHGIDWIEVQNALDEENGRMRGASTITMQVARNLFLWGGHSWIRKGLEAPLALYADFILPKRRIMEIYLNVAQWDVGVFGAAAATQHFFGVPPSNLSPTQAALLAAALPDPGDRFPSKPSPGLLRIARRIMVRAVRLGPAADCVLN